jgi:hypothetical protein
LIENLKSLEEENAIELAAAGKMQPFNLIQNHSLPLFL